MKVGHVAEKEDNRKERLFFAFGTKLKSLKIRVGFSFTSKTEGSFRLTVGGPATISSWDIAFRQEDDMHLPPNLKIGCKFFIAHF
jgi:hypothetical protein